MPTHKMLSPLRTNISNPSTSESTSIVFEIHHYDYAKIEYPSNLYNSFDMPPINENQGNGWSRISKDYDQGNLLKGIDKKTVRREGIEPIKRVFFTYVLFSVTHFLFFFNSFY